MDEEAIIEELYKCFNLIRSTVEGVIPYNNGLNVWNVPGGLKRVKKAAFKILTNGLQEENSTSKNADNPLQEFCLKLIPSLKTSMPADQTYEDVLHEWLEKHLLGHTLHERIKNLFVETWSEKILSSYKAYAYVKNEELLKAFLSCLDALQHGSMNQLSSIKPFLMNRSTFKRELIPWVKQKIHEQEDESKQQEHPTIICPGSFGLYKSTESDNLNSEDIDMQKERALTPGIYENPEQPVSVSSDLLINSALSAVCKNEGEEVNWYGEQKVPNSDYSHLREMSRSESSLYQEIKEPFSKSWNMDMNYSDTNDAQMKRSFTFQNMCHISTNKKTHQRSKSDHLNGYKIGEIKEDSNLFLPISSNSLPKEIMTDETDSSSYYHYDHNQMIPKPYEGQSLYSYLESRQYESGAQLDKENAHFSICEALIAAIEQMRCQSIAALHKDKSKKYRNTTVDSEGAFNDPNCSSSPLTTNTSSSDPTTDDACFSDSTQASSFHKPRSIGMSWENVSLTPRKMRREIDVEKPEIIKDEEIPPNDFTAEAVAKSLLQKFRDRQLPAASELKWIVSEMDVPQELLPLPTAWPVSPDSYLKEDEQPFTTKNAVARMPSLLRGTYEWAPPRAQIIFVPHPFVKRKIMLQRQHYRCRGCGLKVSPDLSKTFRLCEYLGKYFCTSCHQREESVIPAKILSKWDFKKYPISDFARDLLKKIHLDPLFNVMDVSPKLYNNVRPLNAIKTVRIQLHYMKEFLETCRYAESCQKELSKLSFHITDDPHSYSIHDLLQVKNGELQKTLTGILARGMKHINEECEVCPLKGFICEICSSDEILYPFDLHKVHVCQNCKACYHSSCYVKGICNKCERIKARKAQIKADLPDFFEEEPT